MSETIPPAFSNLWSLDRALQNEAYYALMALTEERVDWADAAWDETVKNLTHKDNHNRAIAAQLLCNLARSQSEARVIAALPALFAVTYDPRFVTARHCLLALGKIGAAGENPRRLLLSALATRFADSSSHKNATLIRHDILTVMKSMHEATGDGDIPALADKLIATEADPRYLRKYRTLWPLPKTSKAGDKRNNA